MTPCVCTHTYTHTHTHTQQELTGQELELVEFMSGVESIGTNLVNSEKRDNARRLRILIKKRIRDASGKLKLQQKGSVGREGGNEGGREGRKEG